MTLIKSISGIRGTIGGRIGDNFTPQDIVACTAAYGHWLLGRSVSRKVVIGRDARISGDLVSRLCCSTLQALGLDVVDLGLSTTPTVEMAVVAEQAAGGIILTASHNPVQWNALKFLNEKGEFISAQAGASILEIIAEGAYAYADVDSLGSYKVSDQSLDQHLEAILALPLVNADAIRDRGFKVVVDCVNSTGSISMLPLLERMGVQALAIHDDLSGRFAHNPEPLPAHLQDLSQSVVSHGGDLGIALDPDVDRLAFVNEDGSMFGEEYTIVAIADYVLRHRPGNTVSNLSSTQALKDVTEQHGGQYHASAVGEVNVVEKMKEVNAVFGGEGNGGVIYPPLHYGRDALVGTALFLSHLATLGSTMTELRRSYPPYEICKLKVPLDNGRPADEIIAEMQRRYASQDHIDIDGLKLIFPGEWVHLRKSNTEPIIRVYAESQTLQNATNLAQRFIQEIEEIAAR